MTSHTRLRVMVHAVRVTEPYSATLSSRSEGDAAFVAKIPDLATLMALARRINMLVDAELTIERGGKDGTDIIDATISSFDPVEDGMTYEDLKEWFNVHGVHFSDIEHYREQHLYEMGKKAAKEVKPPTEEEKKQRKGHLIGTIAAHTLDLNRIFVEAMTTGDVRNASNAFTAMGQNMVLVRQEFRLGEPCNCEECLTESTRLALDRSNLKLNEEIVKLLKSTTAAICALQDRVAAMEKK